MWKKVSDVEPLALAGSHKLNAKSKSQNPQAYRRMLEIRINKPLARLASSMGVED